MNGSGALSASPPARALASAAGAGSATAATAFAGRLDFDARLRGGGDFGVGIGPGSAPLAGAEGATFLADAPAAPRVRFLLAALVACRLFGPRTGVRSTKTQPTA